MSVVVYATSCVEIAGGVAVEAGGGWLATVLVMLHPSRARSTAMSRAALLARVASLAAGDFLLLSDTSVAVSAAGWSGLIVAIASS
jgi:hypothetical protein